MAYPDQAPIAGAPVAPSSLYPKFDSVAEAEAFACSKTPVNTPNEMRGILSMFRNTILRQLQPKK